MIDALSDDRSGLAHVTRSSDGRVLQVIRYRAGILSVGIDQTTGELSYRFGNRPIPSRDVIHLRTTLGILRTLKDPQGQYVWQPSLQAGQPETILDRPVIEMVDLEDIAANQHPVIASTSLPSGSTGRSDQAAIFRAEAAIPS